MTSKLNHRDDGSNGDSASKPIHFLRIMHPDNLLQGKLRLPAEFVNKYGKHLSNTMFLKLPNGAEWRVNLEKRDGRVWFQEGWKKFVEHHSLAHGHLLVFKYDGTFHFHVLIFDPSANEIDYPVNKANHKRVRISSRYESPSEGKRNMEAAGSISFTVRMKSSSKQHMYLPKDSLKGYIKGGEQYVKLLVGERSWRVKLVHYKNRSSCFFSANWPAFARENDLKEGDACWFQLLNSSDDIVMNVTISREGH
ncbi:hypothetical protein JHK82_023321 [Glycine max]|nr:hypothetical protein JHK85_023860 [Glycine max]KAG5027470.1 hypothetical protein JHK86_023384 [Glycine max]KAG5138590.1 hypothetical protein JHK82_023321 [Glycine max]